MLYPDVPLNSFLYEHDKWWDRNDQLHAQSRHDGRSQAEGFQAVENRLQLQHVHRENLGLIGSGDWTAGKGGSQTLGVPLALISDPARTPVVVPRNDYHYELDELKNEEEMKPFLLDGKLPVLFVDGHVESMTVAEYEKRNLHLMPKK